jgi:hypothetical protein
MGFNVCCYLHFIPLKSREHAAGNMSSHVTIHNLVISPLSERILKQLRPSSINVTVHLTIELNAYLSNDVFEQTEVLLLKVP